MCIFCKILNKEIPSYKIYEDEDFYAMLDISQATPGHTLVLPKKHITNIFDLPEDLASKLFVVIKKVSDLLREKLGFNDLNMLNNSGEIAGQTVMHLHIHIIPRYTKEEINLSPVEHEYNKELLEKVYAKITN